MNERSITRGLIWPTEQCSQNWKVSSSNSNDALSQALGPKLALKFPVTYMSK